MKQSFSLPIVFLAIFCCCCGCAKKSNAPHRFVIGISQDLSDVWHDRMVEEILQESILHPNMNLIIRNARGDRQLQCAQIDSLVALGADLIIVGVQDPIFVHTATDKAFDAGIPIIFNSLNDSVDKFSAFIGMDNKAIGRIMANYLSDYANTNGFTDRTPLRAIEILGDTNEPPVWIRHKAMFNALDEVKNVRICGLGFGQWQQQRIIQVTDSLLHLMDVDVIVTQNDLTALAVWGVAQRICPNKNFHILGVDALSSQGDGIESILEGKIEASITNVSRGDLMIQTAENILLKQPYHRFKYIQPQLVDKSSSSLTMRLVQEMNSERYVIRTLQTKVDTLWEQTSLLRTKNMFLLICVICIILMSMCGYFALYYWQRLRKQQEQSAATMARQKEQLNSLTQELEKIKSIQTQEEVFVQKLQTEVENHIAQSDFSVVELSAVLGVSRAQLFRKIKASLGISPMDLIRQVRLKKARQMLQTTDLTVQEVAFSVGFSSPAYFAKCYKVFFGIAPASERRRLK